MPITIDEADFREAHELGIPVTLLQQLANTTSTVHNVATYGARGNDLTDDTAAIQAAISACAAAGGGVVYIPNGTYIVSDSAAAHAGCIQVFSNVTLMGESRQGTILKKAANQPGFTRVITLDAATDARISNLTIDGNKSNQGTPEEHMAGIFAGDCVRLVIDNVTAQYCVGDGIDIWQMCDDVLIYNCRVFQNDRSGIAINGSAHERVTIWKCQAVGNVAQQLDTEPPEGGIMNLVVVDCLFDHGGISEDYSVTLSGIEEAEQSEDFVFRDNVVIGPVFCIWLKNMTFSNNTVVTDAGCLVPALHISRRCENCRFVGNRITVGSAFYGAIFVEGTGGTDKPADILIQGNHIEVATGVDTCGITAVASESVDIDRNTIVGNATTTQYGVQVRATEADPAYQFRRVTVTNNYFRDFARAALVWGVAEQPGAVEQLVVSGNVAERVDNAGMTAMLDLDFDGLNVVQQATVIGNSAVNISATFAGVTGGWPGGIPTLIGGSKGGRGIYSCTGSPLNVIVEQVGAMALRRDGGAGTTLYVKESATDATGWVAK
jgi:hypothetical protein